MNQFDADIVVEAVSFCLEAILPDQKFPKKLPPSMSHKLKIASSLAEQIKELGFRGDMGYQTILYCNEVEIRRVLMFLIERLPRDANKTIQIEQTGYVPKLVKKIEENLKTSLKQMWLPSSLFPNGVRECDSQSLVNSFGNCAPLKSVNLNIPDTSKNTNENLKEYWIHHVADVTKQCPTKSLIPSLLFRDCEFYADPDSLKSILQSPCKQEDIVKVVNSNLSVVSQETSPSEGDIKIVDHVNEYEVKLQTLVKDIEDNKVKFIQLQEEAHKLESNLSQVRLVCFYVRYNVIIMFLVSSNEN